MHRYSKATVTAETTGYVLAIQNCNRYNTSQKTYPYRSNRIRQMLMVYIKPRNNRPHYT
jgi:hypothetical protein